MNRLYEIPELPLEPPEDVEVGKCACCGGEIYAGELAYTGAAGLLHPECAAQGGGDREVIA